MVITPDILDLPCRLQNGVKCFELVAEPVKREILPGLYINEWGYNGSIPVPTIQVDCGDCVNIRVTNHLTGATSIHWHGLDVPNMMDGVPGIEPSPKIEPGELPLREHICITHMYHTHVNAPIQQMMGLGGAFIILNRRRNNSIQRDYYLMLQEFYVKGLMTREITPGTYNFDPIWHEFNFYTINGRCFQYPNPLQVKMGENVRIRLANLGHDAHPIHIHWHLFVVSASDGNIIPTPNWLITLHLVKHTTWNSQQLTQKIREESECSSLLPIEDRHKLFFF